jgi:hypothetical protein
MNTGSIDRHLALLLVNTKAMVALERMASNQILFYQEMLTALSDRLLVSVEGLQKSRDNGRPTGQPNLP